MSDEEMRPMDVSLHCDRRGCRNFYMTPTRTSNDPENEIEAKRAEAAMHAWTSWTDITGRIYDFCPEHPRG